MNRDRSLAEVFAEIGQGVYGILGFGRKHKAVLRFICEYRNFLLYSL